MKAEEIRCGNYIVVNGRTVKANPNHILHAGYRPDNSYLPIPLTPEILEKAGFVKIEGKDSIYDKGQMRLYLGLHGSLCYTEYEKGSYCYLSLIRYVHELQNIHHALYNSELPINI